jgi:hypothetical protein
LKDRTILKIKIKDKIILGGTSGVMSVLMVNGISLLLLFLHITKWHVWQLSASLYFPKKELSSIPAIIIGGITHLTLASMVGVVLFYTLYYTGRTFYIVKGIGVLLFSFVIIYGGLLNLKITPITQPLGAQTNMAYMFFHITAGILMSILIVKLADKQVWE